MESYKCLLFITIAFSAVATSYASNWYHNEDSHFDSHPDYKFEYSVHDPHTKDYKSQEESRHGGYTKGYYQLKDADGSLRQVHYTADKHSGFEAVVTKDGRPFNEEHQGYHPLHILHHYKVSHVYGKGHGDYHHATSSQKYNNYHHDGHHGDSYHHDGHQGNSYHHDGNYGDSYHHATSTQNFNSHHKDDYAKGHGDYHHATSTQNQKSYYHHY